jgi:hypothetical protein
MPVRVKDTVKPRFSGLTAPVSDQDRHLRSPHGRTPQPQDCCQGRSGSRGTRLESGCRYRVLLQGFEGTLDLLSVVRNVFRVLILFGPWPGTPARG